jgi:hypothetical protein
MQLQRPESRLQTPSKNLQAHSTDLHNNLSKYVSKLKNQPMQSFDICVSTKSKNLEFFNVQNLIHKGKCPDRKGT